jgi:large subunit ribosomal protein L5
MAKQDNKEKEVKKTKAKKTKKEEPAKVNVKIKPRLIEKYTKEVAPKLQEKFSYKNVMQVPKLSKIVVNMGVGGAVQDSKLIDEAVNELKLITGQKASIQSAKKSISNFKLREGMKIGAKVTLKKRKMYEFLDRLITVALPRVRDFRGVSR